MCSRAGATTRSGTALRPRRAADGRRGRRSAASSRARRNVAINTNGTLEVFVRGPANALWHTWQYAPGGTWTPWASLGGVITADPAAIPYSTGALVVWTRGVDNSAWHVWQNTPAGTWSAW